MKRKKSPWTQKPVGSGHVGTGLACKSGNCSNPATHYIAQVGGGQQEESEIKRVPLCATHHAAAIKALDDKARLSRETAVKKPVSYAGYDIESEAETRPGFAAEPIAGRRDAEIIKLENGQTNNVGRLTVLGKTSGRKHEVNRIAQKVIPTENTANLAEHEQNVNKLVDDAKARQSNGEKLTKAHKLLLRSLDENGNLDTKKFRSNTRKDQASIRKNEVRRSGPARENVRTQGIDDLSDTPFAREPLGTRVTVRPDVSERNRDTSVERNYGSAARLAASAARKKEESPATEKAASNKGRGVTKRIVNGREFTVIDLPRVSRAQVQTRATGELGIAAPPNRRSVFDTGAMLPPPRPDKKQGSISL